MMRTKIIIPDILVMDGLTILKLLRNFGHLIININIDFGAFKYTFRYTIANYLAKYSSKSLIQMSVAVEHMRFFENIQKPFINLKSLYMGACCFGRDLLPFNSIFPNLQSLRLGHNQYENTSAFIIHYFSLTEFALYDLRESFNQNDIEKLLKLNPQLEKLDIRPADRFSNVQFIERLKKCCPKIKQLELGCPRTIIYDLELTQLDQIEKLTIKDVYELNIPLTFSKLKYLEIGSNEEYVTSRDISVFIGKNPHLTSLKFELSNIVDLTHFFRIESLLMNIEELNIGVLKQDIPSDDLINFLTRNRSLKRFSLTARFKNIRQFYNAIISMNTEFKIRNKAIEFILTRVIDHSSIKYVLRVLTMGSLPFYERKEDRDNDYLYDRINYPYNNRLLECCSYDESPHLISQKYDEYINAAVNYCDNKISRSKKYSPEMLANLNIGPGNPHASTEWLMSYYYY